MATDSDATDKGLVAGRPGFWRGTGATESRRIDKCRQSELENKVCDLRSSWFVTLSYRRRAVERSGSTGPTTLSHLALRAGSSTTMMACDEPARVNNFGHFQTFLNYLINLNWVIGSPTTYFPFILSLSAFLMKKKKIKKN